MYLQRQTTLSFPFTIPLQIVWLRKFNKNASVLSTDNSPIGNNKDDVIVPLYLMYTHQQMFKKSFEFGYDYDDVDENGKYT